MLDVAPVSVLAAASSWSSLTPPTLSVLALLSPPNHPPPIPEVRDDMLHPPASPMRPAATVHRTTPAIVLRPGCVTTPLPEHLPSLLWTGIPYPSSTARALSGDCPAIRSLAPGKPGGQAQAPRIEANIRP